MQVRTQLGIIGVIAVGWSAGNITVVRPVMAEAPQTDRMSLAALESMVARENDNVQGGRGISARYLELGMPRLVVDTVGRMTPNVQQDARVAFNVAVALERLGDVQAALARVNGALNRCTTVPLELASGVGCDVRTTTDLALEGAALDRMVSWNITPLTDPQRAAIAHELAPRPVRIGHMTF